MTFLLLTIQSVVCCGSVYLVKKAGVITCESYMMFNTAASYQVALLLVNVILILMLVYIVGYSP